MFNPSQRTPDMSVDVSLGEFHRTHDEASEARKLVSAGTKNLSKRALQQALSHMEAGERLSAAETGIDAMYAPNYSDAIKLVEKELKRRSKSK